MSLALDPYPYPYPYPLLWTAFTLDRYAATLKAFVGLGLGLGFETLRNPTKP